MLQVKSKNNKNRSKYTNDNFVPIKSITNGMIILDNNERVTGVKIVPRNIFILDYGTQNAIIDNLKNVYNMIILLTAGRTIQERKLRSESLANGRLAQLVERLPYKERVRSSSLLTPTILKKHTLEHRFECIFYCYC